MVLRVQARWPGPGKKIFCVSEGYVAQDDVYEEALEACRIISLRRYGKKLSIILDRKTKRRCWFIFIKKEYKKKSGAYYEQIFWITQSAMRTRRPGAYIPRGGKRENLQIIIDKRERYPYKFANAVTRRENLPAGDYALVRDGVILAVAEKKTMDNFLHDIKTYDVLKSLIEELKQYQHKAVVFSAPYSDFINPRKNPFYGSSYTADILADLFVTFPQVQFVFFENRKLANEWLHRWFKRIWNEPEPKDERPGGEVT
ncbi:MAG: ERCC4 domain-containing protein [bacterium]